MTNLLKILSILFIFQSCKTPPQNFADSIYHNGEILTMEGESPKYVEAVAIKNGKILEIGTWSAIQKLKGDSTKIHDLNEKIITIYYFNQS